MMPGRNDTPRVPWPTVDTIRQHADHDHGFGRDRIDRTTPDLLLYEHANSHRQFSAHKSPHRHYTPASAKQYEPLADAELADLLDRAPVDSGVGDLLAEAARRLRIRPTGEAPIV